MKISIVTVVFNSEATVGECVDSVRLQAGGEVEHIVVDGASTDRTVELVEARGGSLLTMVSEPDQGMYDALNKGIRMATGDVVGILHADDVYADREVLEKVAAVFADPLVEACYGDLVYVDEGRRRDPLSLPDGLQRDMVVRYWRSGAFDRKKFWWGWMPPHPTFFVRREVYQRLPGFLLDMGTAADYELMLRFLVKEGIKVAYLPEVLVRMRVGGMSNASLGNRWRANRMDRRAWRVNGLQPYPWTIAMKPVRKVGQWLSAPPLCKD